MLLTLAECKCSITSQGISLDSLSFASEYDGGTRCSSQSTFAQAPVVRFRALSLRMDMVGLPEPQAD